MATVATAREAPPGEHRGSSGGADTSNPARDLAGRLASAPVVVALLIGALGMANGGFGRSTWPWVALALILAALAALLNGGVALPGRRGRLVLVALACLAGWTALSASWSVDAALARLEVERVMLYLLVVATVVVSRRRDSAQAIVGGVLVGIVSLVVVALAIQLLPLGVAEADPFQGYLLFRPVGYANALGALAAMAFVVALGRASRSGSRDVRHASAGALVLLAAGLELSESRGALLALVAGIGVTIAIDRRLRARPGVLGILLVGPLVATAACAAIDVQGGYPAIDTARAAALALVVAATTALAAVCAPAVAARARTRRPPSSRRTAGIVAVVAAVALAGVGIRGGLDVHHGLGDRPAYWRVAWEQARDDPLTGSGAGTFAVRWLEAGSDRGARDAHSLYLESLGELGPVGLALVLVALGVPLVAGLRLRRLPWVPAAVGAYTVFLVHAGLDWDWELPVVTVSGLALGCALLVAERGSGQPST